MTPKNGVENMNEEQMQKMDIWWDTKIPLVRTYLNGSHSLDEGTVQMLEWNIKQGDSDKGNRNRYKQNITNTIATVGIPLSLGGRTPSAPQLVIDNASIVRAQVYGDYSALFASHPLYGRVLRGRGRCYADADDNGTTVSNGVYNNLMTYYKNYTEDGPKDASKPMWDGKLSKSGVPNITYPEEYTPQEDA